jgi:hypothetical protein
LRRSSSRPASRRPPLLSSHSNSVQIPARPQPAGRVRGRSCDAPLLAGSLPEGGRLRDSECERATVHRPFLRGDPDVMDEAVARDSSLEWFLSADCADQRRSGPWVSGTATLRSRVRTRVVTPRWLPSAGLRIPDPRGDLTHRFAQTSEEAHLEDAPRHILRMHNQGIPRSPTRFARGQGRT